jgi:hypothetical protein
MVHVKGCVHATFSGPVRWGLVADGEAMAKVDIVVAGVSDVLRRKMRVMLDTLKGEYGRHGHHVTLHPGSQGTMLGFGYDCEAEKSYGPAEAYGDVFDVASWFFESVLEHDAVKALI